MGAGQTVETSSSLTFNLSKNEKTEMITFLLKDDKPNKERPQAATSQVNFGEKPSVGLNLIFMPFSPACNYWRSPMVSTPYH